MNLLQSVRAPFALGKYGVIVVSIALFVVLDAGVLVLNFYTSYEIADDAHAIQVVSRQTTLSAHA